MNDFRGNSIKDGDMVIVSYASYPHMAIGVLVEGKVRTMDTINYAKPYKKCYLIANPTQEELDLKQEILDKIEEYKKAKKTRQKELSKYKGDMLGGIYSTNEGHTYIYLGRLKNELFDENGNLMETHEGNCYYRLYWDQEKDPNSITSDDIFGTQYTYSLQFLKGLKNVSGLAGVHSRLSMKDYRDIVKEFEFEIQIWNRTNQEYDKVKRTRKISLL